MWPLGLKFSKMCIFTQNLFLRSTSSTCGQINQFKKRFWMISFWRSDIILWIDPLSSHFSIFLTNPPPPLASDILFKWPLISINCHIHVCFCILNDFIFERLDLGFNCLEPSGDFSNSWFEVLTLLSTVFYFRHGDAAET